MKQDTYNLTYDLEGTTRHLKIAKDFLKEAVSDSTNHAKHEELQRFFQLISKAHETLCLLWLEELGCQLIRQESSS